MRLLDGIGQDLEGRRTDEGGLACEQCIERCAETEDIRRRFRRLRIARLFRRHVTGRAHVSLCAGKRLALRLAARQAQVGQFRIAEKPSPVVTAGYQDVLGLHVPVDDALGVRGPESLRCGKTDVECDRFRHAGVARRPKIAEVSCG